MPSRRLPNPGLLGFEIPANPLSRAGVFPYTKRSIGYPGWENDPGGLVNVYRPEDELSDPETLASARLQPWVDDHTMLGDPAAEPGLMAPEMKGVHGTIGEQVFYDPADRTMRANLRLWSPSLNDAINAGKKELSMGFRCVYDFQSGEFEGEHYDAVQRRIRFNHLALVDQGRMGPGVAVLDHLTFAFDATDLREIVPMKVTKRIATAKKLGVAVDALPAYFGMDKADEAVRKFWDTAMDAEEESTDAPAASDPTISEAAAIIAEMADPLAELNSALASITPGAAAPSDMPIDDPADMEPEMDAAGQPVIDPGTGQPKLKKKVTDATPPALAAADSALKVMRAASKRAHAALDGKAVPATLAAFDSAVATGEGRVRAIRDRVAARPARAALDAAIVRIAALEKKIAPATGMDEQPMSPKDIMAAIAKRDALASRVSPAIGAFDHSAMTVEEVAAYACGKLELTPAKGSEIAALDGYLHNRTFETPRTASAFTMDSAVKSSSKASDFIAGKAA